VYFTLPKFVSKILTFEVELIEEEGQSAVAPQDEGPEAGAKGDNSALKKKLVNSGMKLIREL